MTNSGGTNPPLICGINTGQHSEYAVKMSLSHSKMSSSAVYVDASTSGGCNNLVFEFGDPVTGMTTAVTRTWSIKVTQYSCDSGTLLAPSGCTEYFYGQQSGTVQTYNYQDGAGEQLANQEQTFCVR